ncbi:MAG: hypothetical protein N3A01_02420 [Bacteroidales bacterium]|nr:hypothetical protein [Bacteroidales bacterium]
MRLLIKLAFLLLFVNIYTQPDSSSIVLKSGVYFTFKDFLLQKAISKENIEMTNNKTFSEIFNQKTFYYLDSTGFVRSQETNKIWGYVDNNSLFINYNGKFHRILHIGTISTFIIMYKTQNYITPYDYYYDFYYPYNRTYETTHVLNMVLDFKTGNIYTLSPEILLSLFADDKEIFNEYNSLKKRKKKQLMFLYIRKYNEKHPLKL